MKYEKKVQLKNGKELLIRSGREADGEAVAENFNGTHAETDFLLAYPDEHWMTGEQEAAFLKAREDSENEALRVAGIDGKIVGTAGLDALGNRFKLKHRAEFGIGISKAYWGMGIGTCLMKACIELAEQAGYEQLELSVVADNERAVQLYKTAGFTEFGCNPKGFRSRTAGYQPLLMMRLELNGGGSAGKDSER